ncbi:hydroxycarboxylic acid receptor 2 [Pholidichthys leucotaenia]
MESVTDTPKILHCLSTKDNTENLFPEVFLTSEIILGLPGAMIALWIFCFRMKSWKPHVLLLFNLLLADFLLLISIPFRIDIYRKGEWVFGEVWCRVNLFTLTVNRSASIAFMTAVALDRYFKVVHSLHPISQITVMQSGTIAGLIWTAVITRGFPLLTTEVNIHESNISYCRSFNAYKKPSLPIQIHYVAFVLEFLLPWFVLLFCSSKIVCYLHRRQTTSQINVQRAIRAVMVISFVFTFCFLPSVVTGLGAIYIKTFYPEKCMEYNLTARLFMISICFTYLNSALDPLIYCFSSSMFLDALCNTICFKKKKRSAQPSVTVTMNR